MYAELVTARKKCRLCQGLTNPADVDDGMFDTDDAIGPWTHWQGNLSAEVMVVGQDWGDIKYFRKFRGKDDPRNPTNNTLVELMKEAGLEVMTLDKRVYPGIAYFTNAILCLKDGGMQAAVSPEWFVNCAGFLRQQISLVKPRAVVTLGQRAMDAVLMAFDKPRQSLREAVRIEDGIQLSDGCRLLPMYHCGARVLNTHRPEEMQRKDWQRLGRYLRSTGPG